MADVRVRTEPTPAMTPVAEHVRTPLLMPPLTTEERRAFRIGIIRTLADLDGIYRGSIRAFARVLAERHGRRRPFEYIEDVRRVATERIERRITHLAEEGVLRFDWGISGAYRVVNAIHLIDAQATEPPRRRTPPHAQRVVSDDARDGRRRELLMWLATHDGIAESICALTAALGEAYGDHHRVGTVTYDVRALAEQRHIIMERSLLHGRIRTTIRLTNAGLRWATADRPPPPVGAPSEPEQPTPPPSPPPTAPPCAPSTPTTIVAPVHTETTEARTRILWMAAESIVREIHALRSAIDRLQRDAEALAKTLSAIDRERATP